MFELVRNWHIYGSLQFIWGGPVIYLRRAGLLRAMVTSGNSIVLGFVLMVAFGCVLAVWNKAKPRFREIILVAIGLGLFASLSRGPWVGCAALLIVFLATGPNAVSNVGKLALLGVAGLALVLLMPGLERLMDLLPFVGKVDEQNITYRQQLFENSMEVITRNPLFGTPDFRGTQEMLEMAQGEGIIDIVNTSRNRHEIWFGRSRFVHRNFRFNSFWAEAGAKISFRFGSGLQRLRARLDGNNHRRSSSRLPLSAALISSLMCSGRLPASVLRSCGWATRNELRQG